VIPPEVAPILAALVSRYGANEGTTLFNFLAEHTRLEIPLFRKVYAGIEPHLSGLDAAAMRQAAEALFASGLLEAMERDRGLPDPLFIRLVGAHVRSHAARLPASPNTDPGLKSIYETERINPRELGQRLRDSLSLVSQPTFGLDTRMARDLFLAVFPPSCREIRETKTIAALLEVFEARMNGTVEERIFFPILCALARYFSAVRRVPFARPIEVITRALSGGSLSSKDLVFMLYDYFHDDRYQGAQLSALLALTLSCIRAFYPARRNLIPRIVSLQKGFIRISRAPESRFVKLIFETFAANPFLDLTAWVEEGARIVRRHGESSDAARAYFERESELSRRTWREIDSGIHVATVSARLQNFVSAITERPVPLVITGADSAAELGAEFYTDGESVFVPPYAKYADNRDENYTVLLHSVAHECGHIEFGSFLDDEARFRDSARALDRLFPGQFQKSRSAMNRFLTRVRESLTAQGFRPSAVRLSEERMPSLLRLLFFARFPLLLRSLWNMVEDGRVNTLLYAKYTGFAKERAAVDAIDFRRVPVVGDLPPFDHLASALVQYAWFGKVNGDIGNEARPFFDRAADILRAFRASGGTDTYDSMVAAAQILAVLMEFLQSESPDRMGQLFSLDGMDFNARGAPPNSRNALLHIELQWFRDESRAQGVQSADSSRGEEDVRARALEAMRIGTGARMGQFAPPRLSASYRYPEWDEERHCYIEDHCVLFEQPPAPSDEDESGNLESINPGFVSATKRVFMALKPQSISETRGMDDGHEIDFDRYVDCLIDLATGHPMESNYYLFRESRERSVATALVIDMSPSTRQIVDEMSIFRHQKYAAHVMAEALAAIGDRFGIYSSYDFGAAATMFFTVKGLDEQYSAKHVEGLRRFSPAANGWSRLSVGLRHVVKKMRDAREKSKIIFFITDGMPVYYEGPSGRSEEAYEYEVDGRRMTSATPLSVMEIYVKGPDYIRADLQKVREEAAIAGVHLFFIVLDKDSIGFMTGTFGSDLVFLPDIASLPAKLLHVFRTFTT